MTKEGVRFTYVYNPYQRRRTPMKKLIDTALKHSLGIQSVNEKNAEDEPWHRQPANQDSKRWLRHHLPEMNPADVITMYDVRTMI